MFTEVHLGEEDGRVARGAVAQRGDGEVLVVVRVRGREVRVAPCELLAQALAVRVLVDAAVLREVEGLEQVNRGMGLNSWYARGDGLRGAYLVDDRGRTGVVVADLNIEELAAEGDRDEPSAVFSERWGPIQA